MRLSSLPLVSWTVSLLARPSDACDCYQTESPTGSLTFERYAFYDFRAIAPGGADDFDHAPPPVSAGQDDGLEPATCSYLSSAAFASAWAVQSWRQEVTADASVAMVNSPQNVYIRRDSPGQPTYLVLRTTRQAGFQSAANVESAQDGLLHASVRALVRISGDPGAVAGLFTYANATNESDTEILLRDPPTQLRATNQPGTDRAGNPVSQAASVVAIPAAAGGNASRGAWNQFRQDWAPAESTWVVNGVVVARKTYGVPALASTYNLNMWGNGGSWSGDMAVGGVATMDVQWVELVFNVTGQEPCAVRCGVDGNASLGNPVVLSAAAGRGVGWCWVLRSVLGLGLGLVL